jgi:hypothetical protein
MYYYFTEENYKGQPILCAGKMQQRFVAWSSGIVHKNY